MPFVLGGLTAQHLRADLKTSAYAPFAASTSAAALYARRWWLGEKNSAALRRAERKSTARILALQRPDGSFGGLPTTIRCLFALHLLQREGSVAADRAIDWLWETGMPPQEPRRLPDGAIYHGLLTRMNKGDSERLSHLPETPFTRGCSVFVKTSAGILLASAFGRGREARVQRAIRSLDGIIESRKGLWCAPACSSNLVGAYAAHPDASRGRGITTAVRTLGKLQSTSGRWPGVPFAPTFNSLASLDAREARTQVRKALPFVYRSQNRDGSWGRGPNREFTTFLIVQALRLIEA